MSHEFSGFAASFFPPAWLEYHDSKGLARHVAVTLPTYHIQSSIISGLLAKPRAPKLSPFLHPGLYEVLTGDPSSPYHEPPKPFVSSQGLAAVSQIPSETLY